MNQVQNGAVDFSGLSRRVGGSGVGGGGLDRYPGIAIRR